MIYLCRILHLISVFNSLRPNIKYVYSQEISDRHLYVTANIIYVSNCNLVLICCTLRKLWEHTVLVA